MEIGYYISTGQLSKMYTLRNVSTEYDHNGAAYLKSSYVKNLSTDKETAINKALEYTGKTLKITIDELNEISRIDARDINHSILDWGYLSGTSIYLIETWQLIKLVRLLPRKFHRTLSLILIELIDRFEMDSAEQINEFTSWMMKRFKNQLRQQEWENKKAVEAASQNYVGNVGDKMECELTVLFTKRGEGNWGAWYMYNMKDDNDNKFVYIGSVELFDADTYNEIEKGNKIKIKFTIKDHTEYEGAKQNKISRPKVLSILN